MDNIRHIFDDAVLPPYEVCRRVQLLESLKKVLLDNTDMIVETICAETGKVRAEALVSDFYPSLEAVSYYIKNLESILEPRKVKTPFFFQKTRAEVNYRPSGMAFIIAPWNFPFQLAFIPVLSAVCAGNSVILKPSELASKTGALINYLFTKAGFNEHTVQCAFGGADIVQAIIANKPARVLFTGSTATGKEIAKACAEQLIPIILELGGKGPAVILNSVDIERAANGIIYSAFANNGQICVATTRVIIARSVKDKFLKTLLEKVPLLKPGRDYGPLMQKERIPILKKLIADAVSSGANIIYGSVDNDFNSPVILEGITKEMEIFNTECFAPILCITAFDTEKEAIELANFPPYALSASIWGEGAEDFINNIQAGHISVNDAVKGVGLADLPFGGFKNSGYGRYHGAAGIYFFCDEVSVFISKSKYPREINWLPYTEDMYSNFKNLINALYDFKSANIKTFKSLMSLMGRVKK